MHIQAEQLVKTYDGMAVVKSVSFAARPGAILGLVGPAGSGKTTILNMLLGITPPDKGTVTVDETPLSRAHFDRIGYLAQERGVYTDDTLNNSLVYIARLKGLSRKKATVEAVRLIDRFKLIDQMDTTAAALPAEIREKLMIMMTVIHNPAIVIVDEPFANLAPINQQLLRKLLHRFRGDGKTIIIATADFDAAEALCDEVVMLRSGRPVITDSVANLRASFKENLVLVEAADNLQSLQGLHGVKKLVLEKQTARLYIDNRIPARKVLELILQSVNVTRLEVYRPRLHDIYLEAAGAPDKETA